MRLIDADELKKKARPVFKSNTGGRYPNMVSVDVIDAQPTISPDSLVKRGRWISRFPRHWKGKDECSECSFHEKDHRDLSHYKFCPNCGAKMDESGALMED